MKRTLIGALCLAFLAIGCSDQPQPEAEQESQPATPVETLIAQPDVRETDAIGTDDEEFVEKYFETALAPFKQTKEPVEESQAVQPPLEESAEESQAVHLSLDEEIEKARVVLLSIVKHDVETLRTLLKEGVDLSLQPEGNTYATWCVLANFPEGLRVLKEFDFDFDARNAPNGAPALLNGAPALLCVAAPVGDFNRLEMARVLLECGASVDAEVKNPKDPSLDGLTPFYLAMVRVITKNDEEAFDVARFLLEHGADPDKTPTPTEGQTMLQTAIFEKNLPAVELLLKHGASVTKARNDGVTALKIAAQDGTPTEIRQAIAVKAKVCDFTIFGITLGLPLPKEIDDTVSWAFDDQETTWIMPRPFRRFKTAELKRTVDSHRIIAITLVCEMNSELQRKEEIRAVQEALEQKFGLKFLPKWTPFRDIYWVEAYEDGAKVEIRSGPGGDGGDPGRVILTVSVADESVLRWLDDFSAPSVETDLDVL